MTEEEKEEKKVKGTVREGGKRKKRTMIEKEKTSKGETGIKIHEKIEEEK